MMNSTVSPSEFIHFLSQHAAEAYGCFSEKPFIMHAQALDAFRMIQFYLHHSTVEPLYVTGDTGIGKTHLTVAALSNCGLRGPQLSFEKFFQRFIRCKTEDDGLLMTGISNHFGVVYLDDVEILLHVHDSVCGRRAVNLLRNVSRTGCKVIFTVDRMYLDEVQKRFIE